MKRFSQLLFALCLIFTCAALASAQTPTATTAQTATETDVDKSIPRNSKVYIHPMDGFEVYLMAALRKKNVPLVIVNDRELADFEIMGVSETKKAGAAKIIFGSGRSEETASISVINIRTSVVVYADSSHRKDSLRGKRSTAEKLAKYLAKYINGEK